ncbi:hypothetical protein [Methylobacterium sp. V23]|jgi:hypothetical protein|uniref:hypothetical protein n=1 Tax=Methylobacterium sp. V23 TaxID=2044878 RepID=UPI000CDAB999|nr:hypothetical protein [Methylobacterium sp. V23]POR41579.1 hypothetical protein CRT23_17920 [Methylobacterium sp. V23]
MKFFTPLIASACLVSTLALPAAAQTGLAPERGPGGRGIIVEGQSNTTGNDPDVVIARGANGADTITTDSAAGGNANLPERAIPNGSAGGGGGGR